MKLGIFCVVLLLTTPAHASTFVSETQKYDAWDYEFTVKNGLIGTSFNVTEYDCHTPINHTGVPLFGKPTNCLNTEAEARVEAQKQADKFEADKTANGESTTTIEATRQLYLLKNKLTP